jgi:DNA-directed RNA polymerase specialized sigma subunit
MKEERLPHVALEEVPDFTTPSRLMDASQIERGLLLREIREELDEDERQLLSMMMHQYTFRQMADRLDISHVTASRRVNLLKAKIREHLFPTGSGRHPR